MRKPEPPYVEYGFHRTANGVSRIWYGFEPSPKEREIWRSFGTKTGLLNFLTLRYGRVEAQRMFDAKVPL